MTARKRQARDARRTATRVRIGPRDEALIGAVGRFRLCRTSDLARLYFPYRHRDVVADRLRRLYDAGYLEVHVGDRAAENAYALGPLGRRWLVGHGVEPAPVPRAGHRHHLGLIAAWSRLAAMAHEAGVQLVRVEPEWLIRGQERALVIPDARVVLRRREQIVHLALEIDLGNEGTTVLREKLRSYTTAFGSEPEAERPIVVLIISGTSAARSDRLRELLRSMWGGRSFVLDVQDIGRGFFEQAFGVAQDPVPDSRYGNGSVADANASRSSAPTVSGAEPSDA